MNTQNIKQDTKKDMKEALKCMNKSIMQQAKKTINSYFKGKISLRQMNNRLLVIGIFQTSIKEIGNSDSISEHIEEVQNLAYESLSNKDDLNVTTLIILEKTMNAPTELFDKLFDFLMEQEK